MCYTDTVIHCFLKQKFLDIKKLSSLINDKLSTIFLNFLLSISTVRADDNNENTDFYFIYFAPYLAYAFDQSLLFQRNKPFTVVQCYNFSINLRNVTFGTFGMLLGRGRIIRVATQGLVSMLSQLVTSIYILPNLNNTLFFHLITMIWLLKSLK